MHLVRPSSQTLEIIHYSWLFIDPPDRPSSQVLRANIGEQCWKTGAVPCRGRPTIPPEVRLYLRYRRTPYLIRIHSPALFCSPWPNSPIISTRADGPTPPQILHITAAQFPRISVSIPGVVYTRSEGQRDPRLLLPILDMARQLEIVDHLGQGASSTSCQ